MKKNRLLLLIINKKKILFNKNGEEIKFFKNSDLEKLPNIFGEQKNFWKFILP